MAEVAQDVESPAPKPGEPMDYDAFLSYAHRDKPVATAIQRGLHRIGRRFGQLRALRVFRDDTNLEATPDLWGRITDGLDRARFMIVVLSPQSAASRWVNEEVSYWLQHRGHEHLLLVLAEGHLQWDGDEGRFDRNGVSAAPLVLTEPQSLSAEPLYIDVSGDAPWDVRSPAFRDKLTALAAPIHGKPKDQLAGDDLREQRRFRRLRTAAIAGLVVLTVIAVIAVAQRQEAIRRLHDAIVAKLNAEGAAMLAGGTAGGDERALQELLAANAISPNRVPILDAQVARFTTQKIIDTSEVPMSVAYNADGSRLVTGERNGTVRQWDSATGKPIGSPIKAHTGVVRAVRFSADGQTIASASVDGTLRLWNADTGEAVNPDPVRVAPLTSIAVNPHSGTLFTGGLDDTVRSWDPRTGQLRKALRIFSDNRVEITDVTFDPSGNLFAVSAGNGSVAVMDATTGKLHAPMISIVGSDGKPVSVNRIAFSPDGHTIALTAAVAGRDLQLWNADSGTIIRTLPVGLVGTFSFTPDGHRLVVGRNDGALVWWDADTGAQIGEPLTTHAGEVFALAVRPGGQQIAVASTDGTLRLCSATVGQAMRGPDTGYVDVAFSPDGHLVAASGFAVEEWNLDSGQPLPPLQPAGAGAKTFGFVDGGRIVIAASDGTIQTWDTHTGQPVSQPVHIDVPYNPYRITFYAFSSDGRKIASVDDQDARVQLWDVPTGQAVGQPMTVNTPGNRVIQLAFSPDGHYLAVAYNDGIRLWSADTAQPEGTAMVGTGLDVGGQSVAYSQDGNTLAVGRADGSVELWDPHTQKPLPKSPLIGHTGMVEALAFGPGNQLASGGLESTIRLWDTSTGTPTAAPRTLTAMVNGVALSPDGRLAASTTLDGTVLLSPALADPSRLCDKLTSNMSHKQWRDWVSPAIAYITVCPGLPIAPD